MSDRRQSISDLTPSQRELLRSKIAKLKKGANPSATFIPCQRETSTSPLSYGQRRVWFFTQLAPETSAYNIVEGRRLEGRLNFHWLEQAVNEVVRRHETLRTSIQQLSGSLLSGEPYQVIAPHAAAPAPVIDLQNFTPFAQEAVIESVATADAKRPFELARGPLIRITLMRLGIRRHVMLITLHHIIADFWSLGVLMGEITALQSCYSQGLPSGLAELSVQYRDYAQWQQEWMQGGASEIQLAYWRQRLAEPPPELDLPLDGPRSLMRDLRGDTRAIALSRSLSESLRALSRQEGCTLTMTLLSAFLVLLHRLTRQDDIIIGLTVANRSRAEFEPLIGFFVNTLPLRVDLSGAPSFIELLRRVREECLGAYSYQDLPFDKLIEEIHPARKLNRHPLFDILFNSLYAPPSEAQIQGLEVSGFERRDPESKFAITLNVEEFSDQIGIRAVYQRALFSVERIDCWLNQFRRLLDQIVANHRESIANLSLVTPVDQTLLPDPSVRLAEPFYEPITNLFKRWAERAPDHPAITQNGREWSYAEMAEEVARLTAMLRAQGVEKGAIVAVMGQRSFGLMVSMLAVLSSGGVLMPLDRQLPPARKQLLLREAGVERLIYAGDLADDGWLRELPLTLIIVDPEDGCRLSRELTISARPARGIDLSPEDPAYLFCTSGTTGRVKMVLGCHKGLSHFLDWQRHEFEVGASDRCGHLTGLSFDVVMRDIFLPLTSGATLCLPPGSAPLGADRVITWLERERITLLHAVPALAQAWLKYAPAETSLHNLRWVFFAGEPLTESLIRRWREAFPGATGIANLYGPTETTLAKCCYRAPLDPSPGVQPVGQPLPHTQILILDEAQRLCGIGESGQIVIRTPFRSLGYLNAPAENQRRFIPNPFTSDERDLVYLTGDNGRYRPDGLVEILGRSDYQVKIRGVRIELDEVAAVLAEHPSVAASIVVAREGETGEKMLIAYIAMRPSTRAEISDLRAHLSLHLPAAMAPSVFVVLDQLPLTPNGKVDRQALPAPDQTSFALPQFYTAPRTPVEREVAKIWAEALGIERVGVDDNFFSLGGHSLSATMVIARIRDTFQFELPLHKLFETPTVRGLADYIKAAGRATQIEPGPQITPDWSSASGQAPQLNIDQLSDQEVTEMVRELLDGKAFRIG